MSSIPAESRAFIKPFDGIDVTCLVVDIVAWFGLDEIISILNQNACTAYKSLPVSQKALWRQLEPQVHSEKQFITALGVRMLIGRLQNIDCTPQSTCGPAYYNNTVLDQYPSANYPTSSVCYNQPKFELNTSLHNLGNIFINEAIYDIRAYPQLEEVNSKMNRIYDILLIRDVTQ